MAIAPFQLFDGSIGAGPYTVTFDLPGSFSAVVVKLLKDGDTNFITQTVDVQYSFVRSTKTVTFLAGFEPETGDSVRIERFTTRDRQIDYVSGQTLSERNLDNDANRLTMIDQEIESDLLDALRRNDDRDAWDGEGLPSENCADAVRAGGWVTLRQLQAGDGLGVDITGTSVFILGPGDGVTTDYELIGATNLTIPQCDVYLASVYQTSDGTAYEILQDGDSGYPTFALGDDVISFLDPPTNGATIEVKIITGTVTNEIAQDSVDTAQLKDDAVDETKLSAVAAGDTDRFYVIDTTGKVVSVRQIGIADMLDTAIGDLSSGAVRTSLINDIRISDFLNAATGNVAMGGNKITGLNPAAPTAAGDAASKKYVDDQVALVAPPSSLFAIGVTPILPGLGAFVQINASRGLSFIPDMVFFSTRKTIFLFTPTEVAAIYNRFAPNQGYLDGGNSHGMGFPEAIPGSGISADFSIATGSATGFRLQSRLNGTLDSLAIGSYFAVKV